MPRTVSGVISIYCDRTGFANFALELKMVIAAIYSNFTTTIVDDDEIEQSDGYTVGPKGGRLLVRFERVIRKN